VVFIVEEIKVNKPTEEKKKHTYLESPSKNTDKAGTSNKNEESNKLEEENSENKEEMVHEKNINLESKENINANIIDNEKNLIKLEEDLIGKSPNINIPDAEEDNKTNLNEDNINNEDDKSITLSSKQFNSYGPFIGQITGTIKDCCRKAFLNSEPRLYEALYLCLFQIRIESIGKIHSVINKRRGKVIIINYNS